MTTFSSALTHKLVNWLITYLRHYFHFLKVMPLAMEKQVIRGRTTSFKDLVAYLICSTVGNSPLQILTLIYYVYSTWYDTLYDQLSKLHPWRRKYKRREIVVKTLLHTDTCLNTKERIRNHSYDIDISPCRRKLTLRRLDSEVVNRKMKLNQILQRIYNNFMTSNAVWLS